MNKKKILSLLTAGSILFCVSGCAKDESSVTNTTGYSYNSEFGYITLAELPEDIENAKKATYETFKVGDHINVNIPEKISEMHITGMSPSVELAQKLIDHYGFTNVKANDDKDPHQQHLVDYDNDKDSIMIDKIGFFRYFSGLEYQKYDPEYEGPYESVGDTKTVYADKRADGQTIITHGHELSVTEIKKNAETALNDFQSVIGGFLCVPVYLSYDNQWCSVHCARIVNGYYRPFCEVNLLQRKVTPENEDFVGIHLTARVFFQNSNEPVGLSDDWWETSAEYIGEEYEKMVSMTSALKYLDGQLAKYLNLEMDHACLIQYQKDHTIRIVYDDENEDYYNQYVNIETHPFWQFLFHTERNSEERYIAIIDCITGKFSFTKVAL